MQLVSLNRTGPNLTAFQFWAEKFRGEGAAPDQPWVGFGFDTGLSARPGENQSAGGASRVVLEVPATGNAGHALDGKSFKIVLLGAEFVFFLSDGTTPVPSGDFGVTIVNGDDGATVAAAIAAAIQPTVFGFQDGGVAAVAIGEQPDGSFGVLIFALDPGIASSTPADVNGLTFGMQEISDPLVGTPIIWSGYYGHPLLQTASKAFIFSGLTNAGDLPTTDGNGNSITYHPELLTIVAWPIPRGAGGMRAWVPSIVPAAWVPEPNIG